MMGSVLGLQCMSVREESHSLPNCMLTILQNFYLKAQFCIFIELLNQSQSQLFLKGFPQDIFFLLKSLKCYTCVNFSYFPPKFKAILLEKDGSQFRTHQKMKIKAPFNLFPSIFFKSLDFKNILPLFSKKLSDGVFHFVPK